MKPVGIMVVTVLGTVLLISIVSLLRRRLLTMGLGVAWIVCVGALLIGVVVTPLRVLWESVSEWAFASPPFLIAMTFFLGVFLLYLSVAISVLQRQVREIAQFVSLSSLTEEGPSRVLEPNTSPRPLERDSTDISISSATMTERTPSSP